MDPAKLGLGQGRQPNMLEEPYWTEKQETNLSGAKKNE